MSQRLGSREGGGGEEKVVSVQPLVTCATLKQICLIPKGRFPPHFYGINNSLLSFCIVSQRLC